MPSRAASVCGISPDSVSRCGTAPRARPTRDALIMRPTAPMPMTPMRASCSGAAVGTLAISEGHVLARPMMDSSSIRPPAETNSIGAYRRLLHAITASTAAPTSSPAKTMMSAIRMMRSRVPAARCLRSQSSGTKTYGRAKTTSSPAIPTSMRGSPCGSAAMVVSAKVNVQSVRAFNLEGRADTSLICPRAASRPSRSETAFTASARASRSSSDAPARSSGTTWRTRSTRPSAATSTPHSSARSATSPWNVAMRTDQPGAGR